MKEEWAFTIVSRLIKRESSEEKGACCRSEEEGLHFTTNTNTDVLP